MVHNSTEHVMLAEDREFCKLRHAEVSTSSSFVQNVQENKLQKKVSFKAKNSSLFNLECCPPCRGPSKLLGAYSDASHTEIEQALKLSAVSFVTYPSLASDNRRQHNVTDNKCSNSRVDPTGQRKCGCGCSKCNDTCLPPSGNKKTVFKDNVKTFCDKSTNTYELADAECDTNEDRNNTFSNSNSSEHVTINDRNVNDQSCSQPGQRNPGNNVIEYDCDDCDNDTPRSTPCQSFKKRWKKFWKWPKKICSTPDTRCMGNNCPANMSCSSSSCSEEDINNEVVNNKTCTNRPQRYCPSKIPYSHGPSSRYHSNCNNVSFPARIVRGRASKDVVCPAIRKINYVCNSNERLNCRLRFTCPAKKVWGPDDDLKAFMERYYFYVKGKGR